MASATVLAHVVVGSGGRETPWASARVCARMCMSVQPVLARTLGWEGACLLSLARFPSSSLAGQSCLDLHPASALWATARLLPPAWVGWGQVSLGPLSWMGLEWSTCRLPAARPGAVLSRDAWAPQTLASWL